MRLLPVSIFALTLSPASPAAEPDLMLRAKAVTAGEDVVLEVTVLTAGEGERKFLLGSFAQAFGVYVLGPWGPVQPDLTKVRPENWMHQQHSSAAEITIASGKPFRTRVKLSDYFKVNDPKVFKPGVYQVHVKFYDSRLKMPTPIDSGAIQFTLTPKK